MGWWWPCSLLSDTTPILRHWNLCPVEATLGEIFQSRYLNAAAQYLNAAWWYMMHIYIYDANINHIPMLFIYYDDDILISYYRSFQIPWFFHHQPRQMGQVSKTVRRSSSKMWILRKKLAAMAGTLAQKSCFFSDMIYCEETSYIYIYVIYRYNYISIYLFIVSDWKKKKKTSKVFFGRPVSHSSLCGRSWTWQ